MSDKICLYIFTSKSNRKSKVWLDISKHKYQIKYLIIISNIVHYCIIESIYCFNLDQSILLMSEIRLFIYFGCHWKDGFQIGVRGRSTVERHLPKKSEIFQSNTDLCSRRLRTERQSVVMAIALVNSLYSTAVISPCITWLFIPTEHSWLWSCASHTCNIGL